MDLHPLTHAQMRIWHVEQSHPGTSMWNNAGTLKIKGELDFDLLDRAIQLFIEANDSLRLRIAMEDGVPKQYVAPYRPVYIERLDFSDAGLKGLYEWDSRQTLAPMTLIESPLFYFALAKIGPDEGYVYAKLHHIISDGVSFVLFANEIMENYDRLLCGEEPVSMKRSSYLDYVEEEKAYMQSPRYAYDEAYWLNLFSDYPEPTYIKQRSSGYFDTRSRRKACVVDDGLTATMQQFCAEQRVSPFCLLLAAFCVYLNRATEKTDLVIGAPVSNRTYPGASELFGMYVNTVPLRIHLDNESRFIDFLQDVSDVWFSVLKHQRYPYDLLAEKLHAANRDSEPLFDLALSYQIGTFVKDQRRFSYEGRWHFSGHQATSMSIHLNDRESSGRYILDYDYQTPLFNAKAVDFIHEHLSNILFDAIGHPDKRLFELRMLSEEEHDKVTREFNDTADGYRPTTLPALWKQRVLEDPEGTALVFHGEEMSVAALDALSDAFARKLVRAGCGREDVVALLLPRSDCYLVAMLATLKAGAAFLPIDSSAPADRVAYMLGEAQCRFAVGAPDNRIPDCVQRLECSTSAGFGAAPDKEGAALPFVDPSQLAYVIYTSGSTGTPKGVMIEQRSIAHFALAMKQLWSRSTGGRMLCAGPTCFDLNIMEACIGLFSNRALVIADDAEAAYPQRLCSLICDQHVDMMMVTPGRMQLLLSATGADEALRGFREIGMGADALPEALLKRVHAITHAHITNFYGPTEATIAATASNLDETDEVNIGRPLPGTQVFILDAHGNPVPISVTGELYIGGDGVARGYMARDELTAERFIASPFDGTKRLYRTGDLARWYPRGEIALLGRADQQVKIRGYRVETGEVRNRLLQMDGVEDAAVVCCEEADGHRYLCGYITGDKAPSPSDAKAALAATLPFYMIPAHIIALEKLPLTVNGKLDTASLPKPGDAQGESFDLGELPRDDVERQLALIWQNILELPVVDRSMHFLQAGGDSLSMMQMVSEAEEAFDVELSLEDVYAQPTLSHCAQLVHDARRSFSRPVRPAARRRYYPATPAMRRMYAVTRRHPDSVAYNVPCAFAFDAHLDEARLKSALRALIKRHCALRTSLHYVKGNVVQQVHEAFDLPFSMVEGPQSHLDAMLKGAVRPFDAGHAPLMRLVLVRTPKRDALLFDFHHAVCDQLALETMLADFADLYDGEELLPISVDYKDCAVWYDNYLASDALDGQREYWRSKLAEPCEPLDLPVKGRRTGSWRGGMCTQHLAPQRLDALKGAVRDASTTTYSAVLAAFALVLSRQSAQESVMVGTPVSGRTNAAMRHVVGAFINMLPLRCTPMGNLTTKEYLEQTGAAVAGALAHQDYPFEQMVSELGISHDAQRNPLFDAMLVLGHGEPELCLGGMTAQTRAPQTGTAKLDVTLFVYETEDGYDLRLEYDRDLFSAAYAKRMLARIVYTLETLYLNPEARLEDARVLPDDEYALVTHGFSDTDQPFPLRPLSELLSDAAQAHPDDVAVVAADGRISYAELDRRADLVANALMERGMGPGCAVGVMLHRTSSLLPVLFGIMRSGAAYLPIDPTYPQERRSFMLADSGVGLVVCDGARQGQVQVLAVEGGAYDASSNEGILSLSDAGDGREKPAPVQRCADDIAYLIYTSGSTGTPKASMLSLGGVCNLMESMRTQIGYKRSWTCASVTSISFDIFMCEAILPLCCGCTVVLADEEQLRQPRLLADLIEREQVDFLQTTPSRMQIMFRDEGFVRSAARLSCIVMGGEKPSLPLVRKMKRLLPHALLKNGYGPSEVTVYTSFQDLRASDHISIGRPIANTHVYILDANGCPAPIGTPGEACISGVGVSKGYLGRDDLNATQFAPDPFREGLRMYRSGDVCHFSEDGELLIHGRVDHQVKIRGLRIEPGEIESRIIAYPGIDECIVVALGKDERRYLCAYYVAEKPIDEGALRRFLSDGLPAHMVPARLVQMAALPTTGNGKVDRQALPVPAPEQAVQKQLPRKPTDAREKLFLKTVAHVLGIRSTTLSDDYFDLGGDSLGIIEVQARMAAAGWSLKTQDFYDEKVLGNVLAKATAISPGGKAAAKGASSSSRQPATAPSRANASDAAQSREAARRAKRCRLAAETIERHALPLDRVLVTGATGFLGAHIVSALAQAGAGQIDCLVRAASDEDAQRRLDAVLERYFGSNRPAARAVHGEASSIEERISDLSRTSAIIHAAALTEHVGRRRDFTRANVSGTRHVTNLAMRIGCPIVHISTLSVSGTGGGILTEKSYDTGQDVSFNEYTRSKFSAEGIILDAAGVGLDATIMRMGNLTGRYGDGVFQADVFRNAFAMRLSALVALGCYPAGMQADVDLTPVDLAAHAVLALSTCENSTYRIAHIRNPYTLGVEELASLMREAGYPLVAIDPDEFREKALEHANDDLAGVFGLVRDLVETDQKPLSPVDSSITEQALADMGLHWPRIDARYMAAYLDHVLRPAQGRNAS